MLRSLFRTALLTACAGTAAAQTPAQAGRDRTTGLDFTSIDQFWRIADQLVRDAEPSQADWNAMLASTGYRLSSRVVPTTQSDMRIALMPSKRAIFDSVTKLPGDEHYRVEHIARAVSHRAELARYRDSVSVGLPIEQAVRLASRYLPPHATEGKDVPLVAFAIFRDDAYSVGPHEVVIDLDHILVEGGLVGLLAHEFHHSYLAGLNRMTLPPVEDAATALVRTLNNARNEGIADLIDKPYPLVRGNSPNMIAYAKRYNEAYARTPEVVRSIDSALVVAANDSTRMRDVARRVQALLPSNGHYNGSYLAREILETFGVDSLYPAVSNPFAFWRTYGEAEVKRGNPPPFSPPAVQLLNALEKRYVPSTAVADSINTLNRAGLWDQAGKLAMTSLRTAKPGEERCAILIAGGYAAALAGQLNGARSVLTLIDAECAATTAARVNASSVATIRDRLAEVRLASLPPMPKTGVDFSSIDLFWTVADLLARDSEPSAAEWNVLLYSPAYRLVRKDVGNIQQLMRIAYKPSMRAVRDSMTRHPSDDVRTVTHLARVAARRPELAAYRANLERSAGDSIAVAVSRAEKFLPAGAKADLPFIAFALFTPDGYSEDEGIDIDLLHARDEGLVSFLSHELHHTLSGQFDRARFPRDADKDGTLFHAIRQLRNEGIADQVDKPYPFVMTSESNKPVADLYNRNYAATPAKLRSLDSLLAIVADHPERVEEIGRRAADLLPMGSHPNGAYMARAIVQTFGVDSLMPGVRNPFAFLRTYESVEAKRGNPPPFSAKARGVLAAMEASYVAR